MKVYYTARKVIKNIKTVSGDALENSLDWFLIPQVRQQTCEGGQGQYLPSLTINYVASNKDLDKFPLLLY